MSPFVSTLQMNGVSEPRFDRGGVLSALRIDTTG
jgi:hypothetical protein